MTLRRNIPLDHIDTIYERTHSGSTLREFVIDSIGCLNNAEVAYKEYLNLAQAHDEFLEEILRGLSMKQQKRANVLKKVKSYHVDDGAAATKGASPRQKADADSRWIP